MRWLTTLAARLLRAVVVMFCVVVLSFLMIHMAPGGPALAIAGAQGAATPATIHQINVTYGLDRPLVVQFWTYLLELLHGNLGRSYFYNQSVVHLIAQPLWHTAVLAFAALSISVVLGTAIGVFAAYRPRNVVARTAVAAGLAGYSAPVFWAGLLLVVVFAGGLKILPVSGMFPLAPTTSWFGETLSVVRHLVLPSAALSLATMGPYIVTSQASTGAVLHSDYVRTARAKGLSEPVVVLKHALRSALTPVISLAGVQAAGLVSGAILVETVFAWPGIGMLAVQSIERRDTPVVLGLFIVSSLVVVLVNVATDLLYQWVDPRIQLRKVSP